MRRWSENNEHHRNRLKGFVGKNLCASLKNIRDSKDRTRPTLSVGEIFEYDIDANPELLNGYCSKVDSVFNLAGVNCPQNSEDFIGDYVIPVPDYIEENVSTKVVKIIQSYTGVVDKMVWRKL